MEECLALHILMGATIGLEIVLAFAVGVLAVSRLIGR